MLPRLLPLLLWALWTAALPPAPARPAAAAKSARAERYDVDVTIQPDGSLLATETVVFAYTGGPFTYVTRDIPAGRTDGLTGFEAYMDGTRLPEGGQTGQVEIEGRDPVHVVWHFAPTSESVHEFTLTYQALGVVQKTAAADILTWQALPDEYDYAIGSSTITLTYPSAARLLAAPTTEGVPASVQTGDEQVVITARDLTPDTTLIVDLRFAPGSLTTATPAWQARAEAHAARTRQNAPFLLGLAALLLFGGGLLVFLAWHQRQPAPAPDSGPRATPPGDLPPALVGALSSASGEPGTAAALGTLFDLAERGVVAIEQRTGGSWFQSKQFIVTLQERPAGLRSHEQVLTEYLFGPGAAPGATGPLTEQMRKLINRWRTFAGPVKVELQQAGWLDVDRQRRRGLWTASAKLLLLASFGLLAGALALRGALGDAVFAVPAALLLLSIFALILAEHVSPLSDLGLSEAERWKRFGQYLTGVTRGREAITRPDLFERYLAYAAGLGLAAGWLRFFQKRGEVAIPGWFQPLAADDGASFAAMIAATSASAGSGAAGAGGAAAAGGGASGTG
ncbi:MAG: DUF2207 domain-containing protein [Anaerolineales bacterium]|nr:DUF2207 domain-containing protein [Anaerolineales bacterium]